MPNHNDVERVLPSCLMMSYPMMVKAQMADEKELEHRAVLSYRENNTFEVRHDIEASASCQRPNLNILICYMHCYDGLQQVLLLLFAASVYHILHCDCSRIADFANGNLLMVKHREETFSFSLKMEIFRHTLSLLPLAILEKHADRM